MKHIIGITNTNYTYRKQNTNIQTKNDHLYAEHRIIQYYGETNRRKNYLIKSKANNEYNRYENKNKNMQTRNQKNKKADINIF